MPTYQYACRTCDHRFDAVQSFSDASLSECPACTGGLRKVFSSVGIVFKGSGFYRTDSRSGAVAKGENGEKAEKKAESNGSSSPSTSKDKASSSSSSGSSSAAPAGSSSTPAAAAS